MVDTVVDIIVEADDIFIEIVQACGREPCDNSRIDIGRTLGALVRAIFVEHVSHKPKPHIRRSAIRYYKTTYVHSVEEHGRRRTGTGPPGFNAADNDVAYERLSIILVRRTYEDGSRASFPAPHDVRTPAASQQCQRSCDANATGQAQWAVDYDGRSAAGIGLFKGGAVVSYAIKSCAKLSDTDCLRTHRSNSAFNALARGRPNRPV